MEPHGASLGEHGVSRHMLALHLEAGSDPPLPHVLWLNVGMRRRRILREGGLCGRRWVSNRGALPLLSEREDSMREV